MKRDDTDYIGVVMPPHPTFDKVVAYYLILQVLGGVDGDLFIEFFSFSTPDDDFDAALRQLKFYPLDVGSNKYQKRGFRSATEVVCHDFDIKPDRNLGKLIEIVAKNNQSGYLKGFPYSLVWALREAYKLEREQRLVIYRVLSAIDTWFCEKEASIAKEKWMETVHKMRSFKSFSSLLDEIGKIEPHPFTLPWLMAAKFILGYRKEAQQEADWWMRVFRANAKAENKTAKKLMFKEKMEFEVCGLPACAVETDDERAGRQLLVRQNYALVIVKRSSGNVAILSQKKESPLFYLGKVAAELLSSEDQKQIVKFLTKERKKRQSFLKKISDQYVGAEFIYDSSKIASLPEVWYYDRRIEACLNGTPNWEMPPTTLSLGEIIKIVQKKARRWRQLT